MNFTTIVESLYSVIIRATRFLYPPTWFVPLIKYQVSAPRQLRRFLATRIYDPLCALAYVFLGCSVAVKWVLLSSLTCVGHLYLPAILSALFVLVLLTHQTLH